MDVEECDGWGMAAESVNLANLVRCTLEISAAHQYLLIAKISYGALKT